MQSRRSKFAFSVYSYHMAGSYRTLTSIYGKASMHSEPAQCLSDMSVSEVRCICIQEAKKTRNL
jgi:hypothetical protein